MFAHFMMGGLRDTCPHHAECSAVFDQKRHDPCAPPPYSPDLTPEQLFFVSPEEKVLRGNRFTDVEEAKQKMVEALKGIRINEYKNCFEQWKKVSVGVLHQMESTLKVTEVKNVRINTQFLINSGFLGVPPLVDT